MAAVFAVVTAFYVYQALSGGGRPVFCGDEKCDTTESCAACPQDCVCKNGAYCSEHGKCVAPKCGDRICSPGESHVNCCDDCGCYEEGTTCEIDTHTCEFPEAPISDDRVREAVQAYYAAQNKTIVTMNVTGSSVSSGTPVKVVSVLLSGESYERLLAVAADGKIAEELFRW